MPAINPERPESGQFLPEQCVTALFVSRDAAPKAVASLRAAGFSDTDMQVFVGDEGVKQLFADPKQQSGVSKFFQALTEALADDASYMDAAKVTLKNGGALVSVHLGDEETVVARATSALKAAGGAEVQHWGKWKTEQL